MKFIVKGRVPHQALKGALMTKVIVAEASEIIWLEGDTLRCWRSWTRTCLYEALLSPLPDGGATCAVFHVLDDPEHYHRSPQDEIELDRFDEVLALLLRETRAA